MMNVFPYHILHTPFQVNIQLNTIHQSKGGEADNVVLFSDISPAAARDIGDDLHRLFYVAVTRTRNTLYLVGCENYNLSYPLYE